MKNNGISSAAPVAPAPPATPRPDPEVVADAKRRTFTADYKSRILAEADAAATHPGAIGALQRREGLYSSHLVTWRRERQAGILKGLTPLQRGPKSKRNPQEEQMHELRRENQRLTEELRKAAIVIDIQNTVGALLGWPLPKADPEEKPGWPPSPNWPPRWAWSPPAERTAPARALRPAERAAVLTALHEQRFQDLGILVRRMDELIAPLMRFSLLLEDAVHHSHGSHLLAAGMEMTAVSERLGHSSVRVTADVYAHAIRGRDDEAERRWDEFQRQNLPGTPVGDVQ